MFTDVNINLYFLYILLFKLQNLIINYFSKFLGNLGIGHTRYSTSAGSEEVNCQPFVVHSAHGALAVAHNGELFNAGRLRRMVNAFYLFGYLYFICY